MQLNCYLTCTLATSRAPLVSVSHVGGRSNEPPGAPWTELTRLYLYQQVKKTSTFFLTFFSQFYQQTDDVAMRGPASSTTAEIYMHAYERTAITTALHPAKVWE